MFDMKYLYPVTTVLKIVFEQNVTPLLL